MNQNLTSGQEIKTEILLEIIKMEIFDVAVTDEVTGITTRYAEHCPAGVSVSNFCAKLVNLLLFTPDSLRVITVPGTSLTIDKANVESVLVATST